MKNPKTSMKTISIALCVVLLITAFVVQFIPFWSTGESVSIAGYVWFHTDHSDLTEYFQQEIKADFDVQSLVLYSIIQIVVPIAAIIIAIFQRNEIWLTIGAGVTGISGVWSILRKAVLRDGAFWPFMLVISILLVVATFVLVYSKKKEQPNTL